MGVTTFNPRLDISEVSSLKNILVQAERLEILYGSRNGMQTFTSRNVFTDVVRALDDLLEAHDALNSYRAQFGKMWKSKSGFVPIKEMDTEHIANAIKHLEMCKDTHHPSYKPLIEEYIVRLKAKVESA